MDQERRQHPRYVALVKTTGRAGDETFPLVCGNLGPGGAFFSSLIALRPGQRLTLSLRAPGPNAPLVEMTAEVVWSTPLGGAPPAGMGVRWLRAESTAGEEPMRALLRGLLRMTDVGEFDHPSPRVVSFDFVRHGLALPTPAPSTNRGAPIGISARPEPSPPVPRTPLPILSARVPAWRALHFAPATPVPVDDGASSWPSGVPRVLAERYANLTLYAHGGPGVVFRAQDLLLERRVVLKFIAGTATAPEPARRAFLREFKVAAELRHANILQLYDIGSADGTLYYTSEYVRGLRLSHYFDKTPRLDDHPFVYSVLVQLAAALDHAHRLGIPHRAIKPENVLIADDGTVRLCDFGLARLLEDGGRALQAPQPEVDAPAADQRALGAVLYRMLTGHLPFPDGNLFLTPADAPVPDPRVFHPELPQDLSPILLRMLAKLNADRYATCAAAAEDLFPILVAGARFAGNPP